MTENGGTQKNVLHWEIQYARYFNFPKSRTSSSSSSSSSSILRHMVATKQRPLKGTWLPCSSSNVSLQILCNPHSPSQSTLLVSLHPSIFEEHYISKLYFTWPYGSEISGCALKASRVIFATYRDGMGQIEKFALRFSSSTESQKFMESLESLKERRNCSSGLSHCGFAEGIDEERSLMWRTSANQELDPHSCSQQAAQGAVRGTDAALPESFTLLLADSCTNTDLGIPQAPPEVTQKHLLRVKKVADHFVDLMDKMDSVIIGLGGDLAI